MKRLVPLLVGVLCFLVAYLSRLRTLPRAGDFTQALLPARDFLLARPPLSWPTSELYVPSPLTIIPLGLPFASLPDQLAAALFFGLSSVGLAYQLTKARRSFWHLAIMLSYPFIACVIFAQYAPLLIALAMAGFSPLAMLIKPHIAAPLLLIKRPRRIALILAALTVVISLLIYPNWPIAWLQQIRPYAGSSVILAPFGFILLLALIHWRDRMSWLFIWSAVIPQRPYYDALIVLLVPKTRLGLLTASLISWLGFFLPTLPHHERLLLFIYLPIMAIRFVELHLLKTSPAQVGHTSDLVSPKAVDSQSSRPLP